jgi:hypothetical protein
MYNDSGAAPQEVIDDVLPEVRRAEPAPREVTSSTMDLSFINKLNDPNLTQEQAAAEYNKLPPALRYVYDRVADFSYNNADTQTPAQLDPRDANRWLDEFYKNQNSKTPEQNDPAKRADAAARQAEIQEAYRQEVEYQRSLTTLNDPAKSSAERNAARMQLEALAVSIGKRMNPKLGTSESANKQAKNLAGYIGPIEFKMPYSDFAPRAQTMRRGSEERLGLYRQQMEAAGVPVPEMAVPEAPPSPEQIASQMAQAAIQKRGLKGPDGNLLTVAAGEGQSPQPIVARMRGGKKEYRRVGPDGLFYPLTPDQIKALGLK